MRSRYRKHADFYAYLRNYYNLLAKYTHTDVN